MFFSVESVAAFIVFSIGEPDGGEKLCHEWHEFLNIFFSFVKFVAAFIALSIGEPDGGKSFATDDTDF